MAFTLAFDVYGTLINPHGVVTTLESMVGERAPLFSQTWRDKQLEYSFRRGLMQRYENFSVCTAQALDYACSHLNEPLTVEQKQILLASYGQLPAYDDVISGLDQLQQAGHRLFAFSNGSAEAVDGLLRHAKIRDYFEGVVSVDTKKTFKPNPVVYQHFLDSTGSNASNAWLISSNPFDVFGAINIDMRAAWIHRNVDTIYDPWDIEPTFTAQRLDALQEQFEKF